MGTPTAAARPSATGKRYSGRVVAVGLASILAIGLTTIVTLWQMSKEPDGTVLAVAGVDGDSVCALRRGFEERGYIHLVHANRAGDVAWSETLFGIQSPPSVAVAGGRVFVRVTDARGYPVLHAFDIESGEFAWSGPPPLEPEQERAETPVPALHVDGDRVWELATFDADRRPLYITVVDSSDGSLVGRAELEVHPGDRDAFIDGGSLVVQTGDGWWRVARDGSVERIETEPAPPNRAREGGELCTPSIVGGVAWSCSTEGLTARDL